MVFKKMNTGIEILLKRMESHPEEFYYKPNEGIGKWTRLLDTFKRSLTQEEIDAIDEGLRKIERERFTELVMQMLVGVEDETSDEGKWADSILKTRGISSGGLTLSNTTASGLAWVNTTATGQVTLPKGSITLGNTTLDEVALKQLLGKK
jgi:hypothetical protein